MTRFPVFDLDGTLIDSDEALLAPFEQLGIDRRVVRFGLPLADECSRLGVALNDYLARYDTSAARPFEGVEEMLACLDGWAVCSNKYPAAGHAELARLGWTPRTATFFGDKVETKSLRPLLTDLGVRGPEVVFVGDTHHDRECADEVGARFIFAGWNPRDRPRPSDSVAERPIDVLDHL